MLSIGLVTWSNSEWEIISGTVFDLNLESLTLQVWSSFWKFILLEVNIRCLKLTIAYIIIVYHVKRIKAVAAI